MVQYGRGTNISSSLEVKIDPQGLIKCSSLKQLAETKGRLEARREYAGKLPLILEEVLQSYDPKSDEYSVIGSAIGRYNKGEKIEIEGYEFYNPEKANDDNRQFIMNPAVNTASNTVSLGHIPAKFISFFRFAKIPGFSKLFLPLSYSMKFLNKAYKEARKPNPDYKKIAKYGAAGVGGTLIFLPTTLGGGTLFFSVYIPLTALFNIMITLPSLQSFFKGGEKVEGELPSINTVKSDLEKQVEKCKAMEAKYSGINFKAIKEKDEIIKGVSNTNKYLKHHLRKIKLRDVDIEIDAFKRDLLGSPAADTITDTAEFGIKQLENVTLPLFTKMYASQIFSLDGILNTGIINFKADRLLEDMAVYEPGKGYDKVIEESRLFAIAHIYAIQRKEELVQQLITQHDNEEELKKEITSKLKEELSKAGISDEMIKSLEALVFPPKRTIVLSKIQSVLGGGNSISSGSVDYYKLLKKEKLV